jgi:hypothetical protein
MHSDSALPSIEYPSLQTAMHLSIASGKPSVRFVDGNELVPSLTEL